MTEVPSTTNELPAAAAPAEKSYGQVLKSSALIGGSIVLNSGIGIVRTKILAVLLGPTGWGLFGIYLSIVDMVRSLCGMGINTSGVRQIAEATGTGDSRKVARTVTTLRRVALVLGGAGAALLAIASPWVSRLSFGDRTHAPAIALLALAVLFGEICAAQGALLQGMRRIADLARFNLWGTFYGAVGSVIIVWFLAERGIVPSLVCLAATNIAVSWWYARKVKVERVALTVAEVRAEASGLVTLGVAFMVSSLAAMGAGYLVRIIILRRLGEAEAGFYQAAWTFGGYYVGFILEAMRADFFPRLTAVAHRNSECNRLVNEQAEVGLLIAGPGMLATLAFAPLVIAVFYSTQFQPAVDVLRWICVGMVLRVIAWPMGSIIVAKGMRNLFLWSEVLIWGIYVGFSWLGVEWFGLKGTGIAFLGMYAVYSVGIYIISRRVSGFRWSPANRKLALIFTPVVAVTFLCPYFIVSPVWAMLAGGLVTAVTGVYSLRTLCALVPFERLPRPVQRVVRFLKLSGPAA